MNRFFLLVCITLLLPTAMIAQEFKLTADDGQTLDSFGGALDIEGEYIYVGARLDDDAGVDAGAVYVFKRDTADWVQMQKLTASDGQPDGRFGRSVSVDGDYMVVGSHLADSAKGAAYIFLRTGDVWAEQAKLVSADRDTGDYFGLSVGISGEYVIVGAFGDDEVADSVGAAYIFHRTGTTWSQVQKLMPSDGATDDRFGRAVAISGDYAVAGSHGDDDLGSASGSVYVFHNNGSMWVEQTKLHASSGSSSDNFGFAVCILDNQIIVGALNAEPGATGAAYVFVNDNMVWSETGHLTASDPDTSDEFGTSVAISGNLAVVGAGKKNDSTGAAYVFELAGGTWLEAEKLLPTDLAIGDELGRDVAISGFTVAVGALNGDGAAVNSGVVYVFENVTVDVRSDVPSGIPRETKLNQNYPNPFNPATRISYTLPAGTSVELTLHNLLGQHIRSLVREYQSAGTYSVVWDGLSDTGAEVAAGIYFYRLKAGDLVQTRKMTLLR